jgi:hypothetical protein
VELDSHLHTVADRVADLAERPEGGIEVGAVDESAAARHRVRIEWPDLIAVKPAQVL